MDLSALETAAIEKLLEGTHPALQQLKQQAKVLRATRREHTGVGFFTEFEPGPDAVAVAALPGRLTIGDVDAAINGVADAVGFLLFVESGYITMLEGFAYGNEWPTEVTTFSLRHRDPSRHEVVACLNQQHAHQPCETCETTIPRATARVRK